MLLRQDRERESEREDIGICYTSRKKFKHPLFSKLTYPVKTNMDNTSSHLWNIYQQSMYTHTQKTCTRENNWKLASIIYWTRTCQHEQFWCDFPNDRIQYDALDRKKCWRVWANQCRSPLWKEYFDNYVHLDLFSWESQKNQIESSIVEKFQSKICTLKIVHSQSAESAIRPWSLYLI